MGTPEFTVRPSHIGLTLCLVAAASPEVALAHGPFAEGIVEIGGLGEEQYVDPYALGGWRLGYAMRDRFEHQVAIDWRRGESAIDLGDIGYFPARFSFYGANYRFEAVLFDRPGFSPIVGVGAGAGFVVATYEEEIFGISASGLTLYAEAALTGGVRYTFDFGLYAEAELSGSAMAVYQTGLDFRTRATLGLGYRFGGRRDD